MDIMELIFKNSYIYFLSWADSINKHKLYKYSKALNKSWLFFSIILPKVI